MKRFVLLAALALCIGCRTSEIVQPATDAPPAYSIVFLIHGDANYLYHDAGGQGLQADVHALQKAKEVAQNARHGEVFIFHEKPEHKILWLFPQKDRRLLYYRNGKLASDTKYSPHGDSTFATESKLYHKYSQYRGSSSREKVLLYFGHEVPERSDHPYYYSRPNVPFDTKSFARGVQSFIGPGAPFGLIVLSTCNNGTPSIVHALTPYTRYILASPQNLHLSHIDTDGLATMLEQPNPNMERVADRLARETYRRLSSFLQTTVTLSVYDTKTTSHYVPGLAKKYENFLKTQSSYDLLDDNSDCSKYDFFDAAGDTAGIQTWNKAPRFGRKTSTQSTYSGWGCK